MPTRPGHVNRNQATSDGSDDDDDDDDDDGDSDSDSDSDSDGDSDGGSEEEQEEGDEEDEEGEEGEGSDPTRTEQSQHRQPDLSPTLRTAVDSLKSLFAHDEGSDQAQGKSKGKGKASREPVSGLISQRWNQLTVAFADHAAGSRRRRNGRKSERMRQMGLFAFFASHHLSAHIISLSLRNEFVDELGPCRWAPKLANIAQRLRLSDSVLLCLYFGSSVLTKSRVVSNIYRWAFGKPPLVRKDKATRARRAASATDQGGAHDEDEDENGNENADMVDDSDGEADRNSSTGPEDQGPQGARQDPTGGFEALDLARHYFSIVDARKARLANPRSIHRGSTEASRTVFAIRTAVMVPFEPNDIRQAHCAATVVVPASDKARTVPLPASPSPEVGRRHDPNARLSAAREPSIFGDAEAEPEEEEEDEEEEGDEEDDYRPGHPETMRPYGAAHMDASGSGGTIAQHASGSSDDNNDCASGDGSDKQSPSPTSPDARRGHAQPLHLGGQRRPPAASAMKRKSSESGLHDDEGNDDDDDDDDDDTVAQALDHISKRAKITADKPRGAVLGITPRAVRTSSAMTLPSGQSNVGGSPTSHPEPTGNEFDAPSVPGGRRDSPGPASLAAAPAAAPAEAEAAPAGNETPEDDLYGVSEGERGAATTRPVRMSTSTSTSMSVSVSTGPPFSQAANGDGHRGECVGEKHPATLAATPGDEVAKTSVPPAHAVTAGGQPGPGPPAGLQALTLGSHSRQRIGTGAMLDDSAVEWALNMFLAASKHTRLTDSREMARQGQGPARSSPQRDLASAIAYTCEPRRVDDIVVFSACNIRDTHWLLGVSTVSGSGQAPPRDMAAEVWVLDSASNPAWQAEAHGLVEGWVGRALQPASMAAAAPAAACPTGSTGPGTSGGSNAVQARHHCPPCAGQGDTVDCGVYVIVFALRWLVHTSGCQTRLHSPSDLEKLHLTSRVNGRLWRRFLVLMDSASREYEGCGQEPLELEGRWSPQQQQQQQQHTVLDGSDRQADETVPQHLGFPPVKPPSPSDTTSAVLQAIEDARARLESHQRQLLQTIRGRQRQSEQLCEDVREIQALLSWVRGSSAAERGRIEQDVLPALDRDMALRTSAMDAMKGISAVSSHCCGTSAVVESMEQEMRVARAQRRFWTRRRAEVRRAECIIPWVLRTLGQDVLSLEAVVRRYGEICGATRVDM
ncbi:hypothetical protein UCDDA912_g10069 [Diaporthe ampelina]|uniref:Ubiquitin-like protease family profile domain-containing protein n=1 Tax=Diaporthe ampelina TaxID=1214573 RepID=A0A0G2HP57_9PEZI|nr:hypothetical protein UCDDA912_g10069 [Diaporthe ampelina]